MVRRHPRSESPGDRETGEEHAIDLEPFFAAGMLERIEPQTDSAFELLIDYAALMGAGDGEGEDAVAEGFFGGGAEREEVAHELFGVEGFGDVQVAQGVVPLSGDEGGVCFSFGT